MSFLVPFRSYCVFFLVGLSYCQFWCSCSCSFCLLSGSVCVHALRMCIDSHTRTRTHIWMYVICFVCGWKMGSFLSNFNKTLESNELELCEHRQYPNSMCCAHARYTLPMDVDCSHPLGIPLQLSVKEEKKTNFQFHRLKVSLQRKEKEQRMSKKSTDE